MDTLLRQLQLTELEILKVFDYFCRQHNLKYSLYAGTLLGAVRHSGFIPWDDDIDVCMSRIDYDKFLLLWEQDPPEGFILQNKENSPNFTQSFSKIRKNNTTFLQHQNESARYHTGIFLDIFPIDRIPKNPLSRSFFKWHCMVYQLMMREFSPPSGSPIVKICSKIILITTPKRFRSHVRNRMLRLITRYNNSPHLEAVSVETMQALNTPFPSTLLDNYVYLPFEDSQFMCFAQWDTYLSCQYGEYMTPPPIENRTWTHHPLIVDFNHNLEDINSPHRI